jgi:hypothetical protein
MRAFLLLSISLTAFNLAAASTEFSHSRTVQHRKNDRLRAYGKRIAGREALTRAAGGALLGEAANAPHEWGRGPLGFAKRMGSGMAHYAVKDGIQRGVGAALHEEQNNYVRADKPGFGPKLKSAAENTFWVKHKNSNKRYPAIGRFSGDFGSGLVSRLWQPARLHTVSSGLATGGISLGADFGWNLAREYMPEHKGAKRAVTHRVVKRRRARG